MLSGNNNISHHTTPIKLLFYYGGGQMPLGYGLYRCTVTDTLNRLKHIECKVCMNADPEYGARFFIKIINLPNDCKTLYINVGRCASLI